MFFRRMNFGNNYTMNLFKSLVYRYIMQRRGAFIPAPFHNIPTYQIFLYYVLKTSWLVQPIFLPGSQYKTDDVDATAHASCIVLIHRLQFTQVSTGCLVPHRLPHYKLGVG